MYVLNMYCGPLYIGKSIVSIFYIFIVAPWLIGGDASRSMFSTLMFWRIVQDTEVASTPETCLILVHILLNTWSSCIPGVITHMCNNDAPSGQLVLLFWSNGDRTKGHKICSLVCCQLYQLDYTSLLYSGPSSRFYTSVILLPIFWIIPVCYTLAHLLDSTRLVYSGPSSRLYTSVILWFIF